MRHTHPLPHKIIALLLITLTFISSSPLTAAQDSLESLSWGTEAHPDFSGWNSTSSMENTVGPVEGRKNVWNIQSTVLYTQINRYSFPTGQTNLVMEVDLYYNIWGTDDQVSWYITARDSGGNSWSIGANINGNSEDRDRMVMIDSRIDSGTYYNWFHKGGENQWHTLRMELSSESENRIYWNGELLEEYPALGFDWEKMSVSIRQADLYISTWKLTPSALRPDNGASDAIFADDDYSEDPINLTAIVAIMIGVAIIMTLGIAVTLEVMKRRDFVIPPQKKLVQNPKITASKCPMCDTIKDSDDYFCSNCGFQLIAE